jgi:hypothetical protein
MKLLAVGGRRFSVDRLREVIRARKSGDAPLELLMEQGEFMRAFMVEWNGGPAYPALVRDPSKPDLLAEIFRPLTTPVLREERR